MLRFQIVLWPGYVTILGIRKIFMIWPCEKISLQYNI